MKKRIKIYAHPNDPYLESLAVGRAESPDQRFIRFLKNRKNLEK
jgi:D-mannonate dehydratase